MVKQKVVTGVFRHAEPNSGIYFGLALLLHKVLATIKSKYITVFSGFPFLGKTRQSDLPEYTPHSMCLGLPSVCIIYVLYICSLCFR